MPAIRTFVIDKGFNIFIGGPLALGVMSLYSLIWGFFSWQVILAGAMLFISAWGAVQFIKHELRSRPAGRRQQSHSLWVRMSLLIALLAITISAPWIIWLCDWSGVARFKSSYSYPGESSRQLPEANPKELSEPRMIGRSVYLYKVPRNSANESIISEKTFEDCLILGPCVICGTGKGTVYLECDFGVAGGDVDSLFLTNKSRSIIGVIGLDHCLFRKCDFQNVAFAGTEESNQRMKEVTPFRHH